jgi:DNA polymerase I-like protein with 3'-5' exonuclease and polymerase domains
VHDEIVASVPESKAQEIGAQIAEAMSTNFKGIPIEVEWDIKGKRWTK